jgi:DNA-binding response OmpR family regulator
MTGPVFIAEGDKKTASIVTLYLEGDGFQTLTAYDGQQALELLLEWPLSKS